MLSIPGQSSCCMLANTKYQQNVMRAGVGSFYIFRKPNFDGHFRFNYVLRHYSSPPLTTKSSETTVNIKVGLKATIPLRQACYTP